MTLVISDDQKYAVIFAIAALGAFIGAYVIFKIAQCLARRFQERIEDTKRTETASTLNRWSDKEGSNSTKVKSLESELIREDLKITVGDVKVSPMSSLAPSPPRSRPRSRSRSISRMLNQSIDRTNLNEPADVQKQSVSFDCAETDNSRSGKVLRWSDVLDDSMTDCSRVSVPSSPSHPFQHSLATCSYEEDENCSNYDYGQYALSTRGLYLTRSSTQSRTQSRSHSHTHSLQYQQLEEGRLAMELAPQREYEAQLRAQIAESLHFCVPPAPVSASDPVSTAASTSNGSESDSTDYGCSDGRHGFTPVDL